VALPVDIYGQTVPFDDGTGVAAPWPPADWQLPQVAAPPVPAPIEPVVALPPAPLPGLDPAAEMTFAPDDLSLPQPAPGPAPAPAPWAPPEWDIATRPAELPPAAAQPAAPDLGAELDFAPDDFADDPATTDELARQGALSPEDFAAETEARKIAREQFASDRRDQLAAENAQAERDNLRARARADARAAQESLDIAADVEDLRKREPDQARYYKNANPIETILTGIAAVLGGYINPGGPNGAIDLMKSRINADIDEQVRDLNDAGRQLEKRQGAVADLYARNGDAFRSAETARLAAWQGVDEQLAAEAAKYDPRGTAAQRIIAARTAAQAEKAKSAAVLEEKLYTRARDDEKFQLEKDKYAETVRSRRQSAGEASAGRRAADERWMFENGATRDASGKLVRDPNAPGKPLSPSDQRAEQALVVRDAITGKELGKADNPDRVKAADEAQKAGHAVEQNLRRMRQLRQEIGTTVGNRFFRGSENDTRVAEYEALADQTATLMAKADDPASTVRDAEKEAVIRKRLPMFETLTGEGADAAGGREKAALDAVRGAVNRHMKAANVKDYDLGSFYQDEEKPDETPAKSAARAAAAYKPEQLEGIFGGVETHDPRTNTTTRSKGFGDKYLLNDLQVTAPVQALEQAAIAGARDGAAPAAVEDGRKAVEYLQTLAADTSNPSAALARQALDRMGAP
jgi:hypothetical protein